MQHLDAGIPFREFSFAGFWIVPLSLVPKLWNMVLTTGNWDPKARVTDIKGTNLKYLSHEGSRVFTWNHGSVRGFYEDDFAKLKRKCSWPWANPPLILHKPPHPPYSKHSH